MPLRLDRSDGTSVALAPALGAAANEVLLSVEGSSATVRYVSPLNLPTGILVADYEILVLKNRFLVENSIFQVYEDAANTRIGSATFRRVPQVTVPGTQVRRKLYSAA